MPVLRKQTQPTNCQWKQCLIDCCSELEFTNLVITWSGVLQLYPYLNTCARIHAHRWPVAILELELDTFEATYSECAGTPRTKQQTIQTPNLDDAVGLRSILNKTSRLANSADKHPERILTRTNCKQTSTWTSTSVSTTRWGWSRRLTQHICGHTSVQTDYKHLDDNFWWFQRRGSPISQQTWPFKLTCSSQINLKQRVDHCGRSLRGADCAT